MQPLWENAVNERKIPISLQYSQLQEVIVRFWECEFFRGFLSPQVLMDIPSYVGPIHFSYIQQVRVWASLSEPLIERKVERMRRLKKTRKELLYREEVSDGISGPQTSVRMHVAYFWNSISNSSSTAM